MLAGVVRGSGVADPGAAPGNLNLSFYRQDSYFGAKGQKSIEWNSTRYNDAIMTVFIFPLTNDFSSAFKDCLVAGLVYFSEDYNKYYILGRLAAARASTPPKILNTG